MSEKENQTKSEGVEVEVDVTSHVEEFHKKKLEIEEKKKAEKEQEAKENKKSDKKPKPKPVEQPPEKPTTPTDPTPLEQFRDKLIKDFGITAKVEPSSGNTILRYNGFLMIKLLPRKCCRFGVCREVPEEDNAWKAFRINTDEEVEEVYNHVKKLVEINKPEE